jgi:putative transposase
MALVRIQLECGRLTNLSVAVLKRKGNDHGSTSTLKYATLAARGERKGGKMAKPLDGTALLAYFRRFNFSQETQELLKRIRSSPPNRTPGAHRGNMPVWYPSKKMQCVIKAESAKVEFAFLLAAEHDDAILEIWDQPPSIPLEYLDKRGHLQRPMHTADYFIFGREECGWIECKPIEELLRLEKTRPNRFVRDELGVWRCPPGETFAATYGLTYRVWSSDQINWIAQDNALYLEDYYQPLEQLHVPEQTLAVLFHLVDEQPGIMLADLREAAEGIPADLINIAIARHNLYIDLGGYRLSEPAHTPVFCQKHSTLAPVLNDYELPSLPPEVSSRLTSEGQALFKHAKEADSATAVFRNRVIHPEQYDDEEQARTAEARAAVPARTRRRWQQLYREAETLYGNGFLGLLPQYHHCGGNRKIEASVIDLIHQVLETHYDTVRRAPKRGAYGEYLKCSEERALRPVSQQTFYLEAQRHKAAYEQTLARQGARAAYPFKDCVRDQEQTTNRHGTYAWGLAHIDHTELDLALCDSRTGQVLGKCWLTLLILAFPRRIAAFYLTFDPPSYRSCMMTLRLCVKRYGRLPTALVVDGGPEFQSIYFEQLLALYQVRKQQRPAHEPRFGSPQERLFGSLDTTVLHHLLGNTFPTTRQGTAKVVPGVGVRINHLDYWCEAMRDPLTGRRNPGPGTVRPF